MHLAAAVNMGCVREYMCDGAQHAWLHASIHWHDAVSAGGAHHHKVPLFATCNVLSRSIANVVLCA